MLHVIVLVPLFPLAAHADTNTARTRAIDQIGTRQPGAGVTPIKRPDHPRSQTQQPPPRVSQARVARSVASRLHVLASSVSGRTARTPPILLLPHRGSSTKTCQTHRFAGNQHTTHPTERGLGYRADAPPTPCLRRTPSAQTCGCRKPANVNGIRTHVRERSTTWLPPLTPIPAQS